METGRFDATVLTFNLTPCYGFMYCNIVFQRKREVAKNFNLTPQRDYYVKLGYDSLFVNSTLTTTDG